MNLVAALLASVQLFGRVAISYHTVFARCLVLCSRLPKEKALGHKKQYNYSYATSLL